MEQIAYATPEDDRPAVSIPLAQGNFVVSLIPAPVGTLIVGMAYVGADLGAGALGLLWLVIGGLATFGTVIVGLVGLAGTFSRRGEVGLARLYFGGAILAGVVSCAAAVACFVFGSYFVGHRPFHLAIDNQTPATVTVSVHFSDGDVVIGPVAPHSVVQSSRMRTSHAGALQMTVSVGGRSATTQAADYVDEDDRHDPYPIEINPSALPEVATTQP